MNTSALVSGIVLSVIGIGLLAGGILGIDEWVGKLILSAYGIIVLCVGLYMLFNSEKENEIEQVRKRNK